MTFATPLQQVFEAYEHITPFAFKEQFLATPERPYNIVLEGVMHKIWHHPRWLKPLFYLLGKIGILVPQQGENIPAQLEVVPGYFANGQPYHEWNRTIAFAQPATFNTEVVYDERFENVADLVGNGRFLHMVWDAKFTPPHTFTLDTIANAIRLHNKLIYMPKWLWSLLLGSVKFIQHAYTDDPNKVDIDLRVVHPIFGEVFGYSGTFHTVRYEKQ